MAKMTIKRSKESAEKKVIMHRIADIRGGVGIKTAGLEVGDVIPEGTPVLRPVNGLCEIVKWAVVYESADSATTIKVKKGHLFKVGDKIAPSRDEIEITAIDKSNASYDTFTLASMVAVVAEGIVTSVLSANTNSVIGITGTTAIVESNANIQMDVWVVAVTKGWPLALTNANPRGIINY